MLRLTGAWSRILLKVPVGTSRYRCSRQFLHMQFLQIQRRAVRFHTRSHHSGMPGRRRRSDRGVAIVEGALMAPVFFLLIFAILEMSLVLRQYLGITSATRATARTASAVGNDADADHAVLTEFEKLFKTVDRSEIEYMIVFKPSGPEVDLDTAAALAACKVSSVAGLCNRYVASDVDRPAADFGCGGGSPDRFWCPSTREVALTGPPDFIGIYVKSRYRAITGIVGQSYDLTDQVIFRVEPRER